MRIGIGTASKAVRVAASAAAALLLAACGGGGGGGGHSVSADLQSVARSGVDAAKRSRPGDFAADFLRSRNFTALRIEVDYPAGSPPSADALELLRERLAERCDKPDGVDVFLDDAIDPSEFGPTSSADDLAAIEDVHRETYSDSTTRVAALYVLCAPGAGVADTEDEVLGLAYRGSSIALFLDATNQGDDPWTTTAEVEGTALVHEAGHVLGLVNQGVPMLVDHEDPAHPGHDADPASVMYFAITVPRFAPNLGDPDFAQFGPECIADLRAFGGL